MPTARDVMTRKLVTLRPDSSITEAIGVLLRRDVSGVPVVDADGTLVGILSERDCLRVLAVGEYDAADEDRLRSVAEFMTPPIYTVTPEVGLYSLADFFLTHHQRRLPVVEEGRLVGLVSRRDALRGIHDMIRRKQLPARADQRTPRLYPSATDASAEELGERLR
jgi:CBS domain-containing protein